VANRPIIDSVAPTVVNMCRLRLVGILPILLLAGCSSKQNPSTVAFQDTPAGATSPQPAQAVAPAPPPITLPEGTIIRVRLGESLDTRTNRVGEPFTATLDAPIVVDSNVVIPRGANFTGRIDASKASGRLKGRAIMGLRLDSFELNGNKYQIATRDIDRVSGRHRRRNIVLIGGGAGTGATIGAVAGGPAGAAIGAGAGAGAGTIAAVVTGKKNVHIAVETVLSFKLRDPVEL
jgi:hypothetical protein